MAFTKKEREEFVKTYGYDPVSTGLSTSNEASKAASIFNDKEKEEFKSLYGFDPGTFNPASNIPPPIPERRQAAPPSYIPPLFDAVKKAPLQQIGQFGSENFIMPLLKTLNNVSKPIQNYLDPRGYSQNDTSKLVDAAKATPATAFNLFGLYQSLINPLKVPAASAIGGVASSMSPIYNWLTSPLKGGGTPAQENEKLMAIPKGFQEGSKRALENAPMFNALTAFTNPLISQASQAVIPAGASHAVQQAVSRGTTAALDVPEGMAIRKLQGQDYKASDIPVDVLQGLLFGGPQGYKPGPQQADITPENVPNILPKPPGFFKDKGITTDLIPSPGPDFSQPLKQRTGDLMQDLEHMIKYNGALQVAHENPGLSPNVITAIYDADVSGATNPIDMAKKILEQLPPEAQGNRLVQQAIGRFGINAQQMYELSQGTEAGKVTRGMGLNDMNTPNPPTSFTSLVPGGNIPESYGADIAKAQGRAVDIPTPDDELMGSPVQAYMGNKATNGVPEPEIAKVDTKALARQQEADAIQEKFVDPKTPDSWFSKSQERLKKLNPWRFESGKIEAMGPEGKELVTLGRRANDTAIVTLGEMRNLNKKIGIPDLSDDELVNVRAILEGKAEPINDKVGQVATDLRNVFDKYGKATDVPLIENYYPRRLNDAGRKFYEIPENKNALIDQITEEEGINRMQAVKLVDGGLRRGSFEFDRTLKNVPDEFRLDPEKELYQWQNEVARRKGVIENFGKKDEVASDLLSKIGAGNKREFQMKNEAQAYVDRVAGRINNSSELDPIYNFLKSSMVISKINPFTTVGNSLQGSMNSYLKYGPRGSMDAILGSEGDKLVKDLGINDLRGKIGDEIDADSWANKWMGAMGMNKTERMNYSQGAQATDGAIRRAFDTLVNDPSNTQARQLLKDHAMFPDDADLARALLTKQLPEMERKIGIVEGVRQQEFFPTAGERPAWANTGAGSTAYIFHSYLLNQLQLLAKAPADRQLAYLMILAPVSGLPMMVLRRVMQGKELPKDPVDWYVSSTQAGPGTPTDIANSLFTNPESYALGGFSPVTEILRNKFNPKYIQKHFSPLGGFLNPILFPKKK